MAKRAVRRWAMGRMGDFAGLLLWSRDRGLRRWAARCIVDVLRVMVCG